MSNAEVFLDAFVSIEKSLNRLVQPKEYLPYNQLLQQASKHSHVVKNRYDSLKEYGELRNAIVHQRGNEVEIIAEPSDVATKDIVRIAHLLNKDQNVLCYATQPVQVLYEKETLESAYQVMKEASIHKLPIYADEKCVGLLSMDVIADWLMEGKSKDASIREVLNKTSSERVVFVNRYAMIQDVILIFDKAVQKQQPAPVILISEHGYNTEKPLGILSSYDLVKIISILS